MKTCIKVRPFYLRSQNVFVRSCNNGSLKRSVKTRLTPGLCVTSTKRERISRALQWCKQLCDVRSSSTATTNYIMASPGHMKNLQIFKKKMKNAIFSNIVNSNLFIWINISTEKMILRRLIYVTSFDSQYLRCKISRSYDHLLKPDSRLSGSARRFHECRILGSGVGKG